MKYIGVICCFMVLLLSCQKFVRLDEYEQDALDPTLVIDGFISSSLVPPVVRLSQSNSFSDWTNGQPRGKSVTDAIVTISDGETTIDLLEYNTPGLYTTDSGFKGEIGKTYTLTINYKGKTYTAQDELLAVENPNTTFPLIIDSKPTELNGTEYQWTMARHQFGWDKPTIIVTEYFTEKIIGSPDSPQNWTNRINPLTPFTFDKNDLNDLVNQNNIDVIYGHTGSRPDASWAFYTNVPIFTYEKTGKVKLYQFSLSRNYHRYLLALFSDTEWDGLFSSLPGNLPSNISNGAVGYFWATDIKMTEYPVESLFQ